MDEVLRTIARDRTLAGVRETAMRHGTIAAGEIQSLRRNGDRRLAVGNCFPQDEIEHILLGKEEGIMLEDTAYMERRLGLTPLRRVGEPDEIAGVAVMLASRAGGFITGHNLVVDGGTTIGDGN